MYTGQAATWLLRLNRAPGIADLISMLAITILLSLGFAYMCAVLVLGVMAVRIDDSHRFVRLVIETRKIRRQLASPLDANKKDAGSDDDVWPEPL